MPIVPTQPQMEALAADTSGQPVVMLNLLRFKQQADGVDAGMSGREAYERYGREAASHLARAGGRVLQAVTAKQAVIGPDGEWDMAILVEYPSAQAFLGMASDPEYQRAHAHRDAALADSRLIACSTLSPALDSTPA